MATLTQLEQNLPDIPASLLIAEEEIAVLTDFAQLRRVNPPETLADPMLLVSMIGGNLNRKRDGPPVREFR